MDFDAASADGAALGERPGAVRTRAMTKDSAKVECVGGLHVHVVRVSATDGLRAGGGDHLVHHQRYRSRGG
jgi:hypothetical protein